jgi:hypothetical protein
MLVASRRSRVVRAARRLAAHSAISELSDEAAELAELAKRIESHRAAGLRSAPIERFSHDQELAPPTMTRAAHQIANAVTALYQAKPPRISQAEKNAADRFADDYVLGILGVTDHERARGRCDPASLHIVQLARCRAVTSHNAIAALLGRNMTALAIAFIVDDVSYRAMDRRLNAEGDHRKEIAGQLLALLQVMPGLYLDLDHRHGRTPVRRAA